MELIRLDKHNKGRVKSTKPYRPWCVIYTEDFENKSDAFKRKYRLGNISSGIDAEKFGKLRYLAFKDIKKSKAKLYLGCLLCMHYSSKVQKVDLKKLLLSGERIAEITVKAGLGEIRS